MFWEAGGIIDTMEKMKSVNTEQPLNTPSSFTPDMLNNPDGLRHDLLPGISKYEQHELIIKPEALDLNFMPKVLHHREIEYDKIASFIAPIIQGCPPDHFMIYGAKGTGKTTVMKYILQNDVQWVIQKYNMKIYPIFVSCKSKTSPALIREILTCLKPDAKVPKTGVHVSVYVRTIEEHMQNNPGIYIFCLDDIEQLLEYDALELLTNMNRPGMEHLKFSISGISSNFNFWSQLSEPLQSRFIGEKVVFSPYDIITLTSIIKERAELALKPGALYSGAAALIAVKADGDARYAIKLLSAVAKRCQQDGLAMIVEEDVQAGQRYFDRNELFDYIASSSLHHQIALVSIIDLQRRVLGLSMSTQIIHDHYCKLCSITGVSPRARIPLWRFLEDFTNYGILNSDIINTGRKGGRSRVYKLIMSDEEILTALKDQSRTKNKDSELVHDMMREIKLIKYEPNTDVE